MTSVSRCSGCGSGDIVVDWAAGDTVCRGCGLVLAARLLGEGAEWRTFKDKKEAGQDVLSRAATCPANVAMPPCLQLSTEIARTSATTHAKSLVHAHGNSQGHRLLRRVAALESSVASLCQRLALPARVENAAKRFILTLSGGRSSNLMHFPKADTKRGNAVVGAAVCLASRTEGCATTLKAIDSCMWPRVGVKTLGRALSKLKDAAGHHSSSSLHGHNVDWHLAAARAAGTVGLTAHADVRAVASIAAHLHDNVLAGCHHATVVAAAAWVVGCETLNPPLSVSSVASRVGVGASTLKDATDRVRTAYPQPSVLFPTIPCNVNGPGVDGPSHTIVAPREIHEAGGASGSGNNGSSRPAPASTLGDSIAHGDEDPFMALIAKCDDLSSHRPSSIVA